MLKIKYLAIWTRVKEYFVSAPQGIFLLYQIDYRYQSNPKYGHQNQFLCTLKLFSKNVTVVSTVEAGECDQIVIQPQRYLVFISTCKFYGLAFLKKHITSTLKKKKKRKLLLRERQQQTSSGQSSKIKVQLVVAEGKTGRIQS